MSRHFSNRFPNVIDSELQFNESGLPVVTLHYDGALGTTGETSVTRVCKRLLANGDTNTKLRKNGRKLRRKRQFVTRGLPLAPAQSAGVGNVCAFASAGCLDVCLNESGLGAVFVNIQIARQIKTVVWYKARDWFKARLLREVQNAQRTSDRNDTDLAARLNVFSDIAWELLFAELIPQFPRVQFYDYTKNPQRAGAVLPNYWVTLSRSETNESDCINALQSGANSAFVFADALPERYKGFRVVDGDETDLRFLDDKGVIVGLKLKTATIAERLQAIESGFAIVT